jgi:two-component system, NarL family, response regulator LiaR
MGDIRLVEPTARPPVMYRDAGLRIVLVDPDPLARRVIREGLERAGGFAVEAEATTGAEAVRVAEESAPELMLMEMALPDQDGIDVIRRIHRLGTDVRVVVFTAGVDADRELVALRAGACGLLSKEVGIDAAIGALRGVARGEAAISRMTTMTLIEALRRSAQTTGGIRPVRSNLTDREWEVLDLLATGATTPDIAGMLFLTQETVYSHVKNIMRKLGVRSRAEAVQAASRLLEPMLAA